MSIQYIATYLIILYAVGYCIYHLIKIITKKKSACGGSCGGCDFKNELRKKGIHAKSFHSHHNFTYIKN